ADGPARRYALEVHVGRCADARFEEVRLVVDEGSEAVRSVAPAQPRPIDESRQRLDAILRHASDRGEILMERVNDCRAGYRLRDAMHVIGAGDAGIPGAEVAKIEIVAGVPVHALNAQEAYSDRAGVTQPTNRRGLADIER